MIDYVVILSIQCVLTRAIRANALENNAKRKVFKNIMHEALILYYV